jgi:hypothetical protein
MFGVVKSKSMERISDERWSHEDNVGHEVGDYSKSE